MKNTVDSKFKTEKGPVHSTVNRLENMLQAWEEVTRFERLGALLRNHIEDPAARIDPNSPSARLEGPVLHSDEYRKHVLSIRSMEEFDMARFGTLKRIRPVSEKQKVVDSLINFIPVSVAQWRLESSRVYNLSTDLELVLAGTKLGDMTWDDIHAHLPFKSFGISLPVPIYVSGSESPCDFILVNTAVDDEGGTWLAASVFPQFMGTFRQTPKRLVEKTEADIRAGKIDHQTLKFASDMGMNTTDRAYSLVKIPLSGGKKISDTLKIAHEQGFEQVLQIVGGFSLYNAALRNNKTHLVSEWKPAVTKRTPTPDAKAITDEAQICSVAFQYKLTPELRKKLVRKYIKREKGVEMPAGYVEAYWRRKKGTGHDPEAPRCEHVSSYNRGFDRLVEGSLPGGTQGDIN